MSSREGFITHRSVTVDNYNGAQSDVYFDLSVKMGAFGKFLRLREAVPVDKQGGRELSQPGTLGPR